MRNLDGEKGSSSSLLELVRLPSVVREGRPSRTGDSLVTACSRQASALPCACAMAVACCQTPTGLPHATLTSFMLFGSNDGRGFLVGIW